MASNEFKFESVQDNKSISEYLKVLTEGFENGELYFKNGNEQILLKPEGMLNLEVKAKQKDNKTKLSIKFSWKESENNSNKDNKLIINSKIG